MYMGKGRFDKKTFLRSMTVDYLKTCNLDQDARDQLLNMCSKLDFSFAKYLIDFYVHGYYDWYEQFLILTLRLTES